METYPGENMETKKWFQSKTIWIGICTSLSGIIPLAVVFVQAVSPNYFVIVAAIAALTLGAVQVLRRTWLDPQTPPAAIK